MVIRIDEIDYGYIIVLRSPADFGPGVLAYAYSIGIVFVFGYLNRAVLVIGLDAYYPISLFIPGLLVVTSR